jgi:4-amino-4-deoxy-L-arabinose transferase-like glycosyltransferase
VICLLLAANTILAIASVFFDTWPLVRLFVREAAATGTSVWENAALNGRYSGVFDQPMEAGVAYSAGLAAWVYWVARLGRPATRHLILLGALVIGGFLSVSKVFILGGLPLGMLYLVWMFRMKPSTIARYFVAALVFAAVFVPAAIWLMYRWSGQGFFLRLFDADLISSQGLIALYSAGRFGGGPTTVASLFATTWAEAPLQGFGFGAFSPLDSAYIQFFYQGGLVALLFYGLALVALAVHAYRHRRVAPEESRLLMVLLVLVLGAGIGAPALTLNRSSVVLWTMIVLAVSTSAAGRLRSAIR